MARAQVYVVRIYAAEGDGSRLRGVVEDIESRSLDRFASASELWEILRARYAMHDRFQRSEGED